MKPISPTCAGKPPQRPAEASANAPKPTAVCKSDSVEPRARIALLLVR